MTRKAGKKNLRGGVEGIAVSMTPMLVVLGEYGIFGSRGGFETCTARPGSNRE